MAEVVEELRRMKGIGFPITVINLAAYLKGMISVVCMGRLGRTELAGGALAIGLTNITGYSILSGLAMGMEPICSQAFGSGNFSLVNRALRRTILLLLLASLPIAALWANLRPLLLALRQDSEVAAVAAGYCCFAIPDLAANSLLHPLRVYLRSKGSPAPLMWCSSAALALHLPLTLALASALGVSGIALAASATSFLTLLLLFAHFALASTCQTSDLAEPLGGFAADPGWGPLLRLAVPSCLGVCLEWWWYELMTLAAGYLPDPRVALAAAGIVIQTTALMYTLPTTLSAAASARVGNELGARRPAAARLAAAVAVGLAALASYAGLAGTTLGRDAWARVFTADPDVLRLTRTVLPVIGLCELANCPQTTGCGVLRGSARPTTGAAINLYSFYLVGAPVALVMAFALHFEFLGLCFGLLAAQVVCAASILAVTFRTDWEEEALKAQDLVGRGEEEEFLKDVDF